MSLAVGAGMPSGLRASASHRTTCAPSLRAVLGHAAAAPRPGLRSSRSGVSARADNTGKVFTAGSGDGGGKVFNAGTGGSGGGDDGSGGSKHPMQLWTYLFAAFLAVGGIAGFLKAGSPKSLGGGLSAALILALSARAMTGAGAVGAARVALGITALLAVFFIARYVKTKKVFPAGVGAGLSLLMSIGYVAAGL